MGAAGFRCNLKENSVRFISYLSLERFALRISKHLNAERQFARVAKGVDLRSTAGNCAWVRTPQLTFDLFGSSFNIYEFHPPRLAIMGHMV